MAELAVVPRTIPENVDTSGWPKERELLWKLVRESGSKISTIAQGVGFSRSQVSQYINGDNFNPSDKFVQAVRLYLQKIGVWGQEEKETEAVSAYIKNVNQFDIILTEAWRRAWYVLDATYKGNNFGMVVGPSGCGKTSAVERWLEKPENAGKAILITANGCMAKKAILKRIAKEIGIWVNSDSDTLIERICSELKERPKMIIIDEADQLNTVGKLELLRTLLDGTKTVGIVLVGNEDLGEYILQVAVNKRKLARIHNRVGAYQKIGMPTKQEALKLLERVNMTDGARQELAGIITDSSGRGGFRVVRNMLSIAFEAIGDKPITEKLLRSSSMEGVVLSVQA